MGIEFVLGILQSGLSHKHVNSLRCELKSVDLQTFLLTLSYRVVIIQFFKYLYIYWNVVICTMFWESNRNRRQTSLTKSHNSMNHHKVTYLFLVYSKKHRSLESCIFTHIGLLGKVNTYSVVQYIGLGKAYNICTYILIFSNFIIF